MKAYQAYADLLQAFARELGTRGVESGSERYAQLRAALDGQAEEQLRASVPLAKRKATGAFFTSTRLARSLWEPVLDSLDDRSVVIDPACGAGTLLIPPLVALAEQHVPTRHLVTLVRGRDREPAFVDTARARLAMALLYERQRSGVREKISPDDFDQIRISNFGDDGHSDLNSATHIVLNPPFCAAPAPENCEWSSGNVNSAAVFVHECLSSVKAETQLIAILPDVLRSGSRYAKWRDLIECMSGEVTTRSQGQFDKHTDVHVFFLYLKKASHERRVDSEKVATDDSCQTIRTIGDLFHVSVGPVVPHRHIESGPPAPFVTARDLPVNAEVSQISAIRRFTGRLERPPLVVIRRTSRPGETPRARATIVKGSQPLAVDNHLIILRPRSGTVRDCRRLVALLNAVTTSKWIDERYQCRHLPVSALRDFPWHDPGAQ